MLSKKLLNTALVRVDQIGFQLEEYGVTDKVNRHNLMALLFDGQQRVQGEIDSLTARVESRKVKVEHMIDDAENFVRRRFEFVTAPLINIKNRIL